MSYSLIGRAPGEVAFLRGLSIAMVIYHDFCTLSSKPDSFHNVFLIIVRGACGNAGNSLRVES